MPISVRSVSLANMHFPQVAVKVPRMLLGDEYRRSVASDVSNNSGLAISDGVAELHSTDA